MNIIKRDINNTFAENIKPDEIRILTHVTVESANSFAGVSSLYVQYLVDLSPGINNNSNRDEAFVLIITCHSSSSSVLYCAFIISFTFLKN